MVIKLKVNASIGGKNPGDIITLKTDDAGTILDGFWHRRLQDSIHDNCVEVVPEVEDNSTIQGDE